MEFTFKQAQRQDTLLRVLLMGKAGSGKTYSALALACHLADLDPSLGEVYAIDAEVKGRGDLATGCCELYAQEWCKCVVCRGHGLRLGFKHLLLPQGHQHPDDYARALEAAAAMGAKVVVVDGLTPAWEAAKSHVDQLKSSGGGRDPWAVVKPRVFALVEQLLTFPGHVIATVRTKQKIERRTKTDWVDLGQKPIFEEMKGGIEYEFDYSIFLSDHGNAGEVVKTRFSALEGRPLRRFGGDLADELLRWSRNATGAPEAQQREARPKPPQRREEARSKNGSSGRRRRQPPPAPVEEPDEGSREGEVLEEEPAWEPDLDRARRLHALIEGLKSEEVAGKANDYLGRVKTAEEWIALEKWVAEKAEAEKAANRPAPRRRKGFAPPAK